MSSAHQLEPSRRSPSLDQAPRSPRRTVSALPWAIGAILAMASMHLVAAPGDKSEKLFGLESTTRVDGQYIVVFKSDAVSRTKGLFDSADAELAVNTLSEDMVLTHGGKVTQRYAHALSGFALENADESVARAIAADPAVEFVQAVQMVYPAQSQSPAPWGLDRIDQRDLPLDGSYTYLHNKVRVNAYVIDSGIRSSHYQFTGVKSPFGLGYTVINDEWGTGDCMGHGTHVAATIMSRDFGVTKLARLHPVRVFGCSGGTDTSLIVNAINWVAQNAQYPAVANLSLGGSADPALDAAVNGLIAANISVVVAAGNDADSACNHSPARLGASTSVITVGNSTTTDSRHPSSNWGHCVDLFAPGTAIESAWWTSDVATHVTDGTSMAAPHVAGKAIDYLRVHPTASPAQVKSAILDATTPYKINNAAVTPNRLLYSVFGSHIPYSHIPGTPPSTPGTLVVSDACLGFARLSWQPASGDLGGYELQVANPAGPFSRRLTTHLTVTDLVAERDLLYRVSACNGAGCSDHSNVVAVPDTRGTDCP